ncbi:MAG: serine/threonine protein kinase, partial [Polyangiaceae bacterium]|nr:serine/threonine protein kinase [Polyangiaceae bacterium]
MVTSPNSVRPGDRGASSALGAKYRRCARLGRGGQAEVFLALSSGPFGFQKLVALKCLPAEAFEQPELVAMLLDEARLAARLSHPNVVQTYEAGVSEDACFLAMEFLEGQSLGRARACRGAAALGGATWARVAADALAGLHYAHELCDYDGSPLGLVHRDVSPQNIFVTYDGQVKVLDFGVAKAALHRVRTETGAIKGKAGYMAPEQMIGPVDRRADIYSLGVVLWEMLTGRKLYAGGLYAVLHRVLHEPVPRVSSVVPDIDPELDAIVARAVEKRPEDRYPTALAMRAALEGYLAAQGPDVHVAKLGRCLQLAFADEREQLRQQVRRTREGDGRDTLASAPASRHPSPRGVIVEVPPGGAPRRASALATALVALGALGMVAAGTLAVRARLVPAPMVASIAPALAPASLVAPRGDSFVAPRGDSFVEPPGAVAS